MITATDKKTLIAMLGAHYSKEIIPYLTNKGILNRDGAPYSPSSIQNIVRGERENEAVEVEILNLIAEKQQVKKEIKIKKSKILKKQ